MPKESTQNQWFSKQDSWSFPGGHAVFIDKNQFDRFIKNAEKNGYVIIEEWTDEISVHSLFGSDQIYISKILDNMYMLLLQF